MRGSWWMALSLALGVVGISHPALAIDLEYAPHVPPYSVGFEHILTVDPAPGTLIDDGGSATAVSDFNFWRAAPPSLGKLEATSSIATDITALGAGPTDEFHVVSPPGGGLYKLLGYNTPGGLYDGENSAFTATGIGPGPGTASRAIWDVYIASTGEPLGTPVKVDVVGIIQGYVDANTATHPVLPDARATWRVEAEGATVIAGMVSLLDGPGTIPFSDDNLLSPVTFFKTVGDTFTLEIDYKLEVDGTSPIAVSTAEITHSDVLVHAMVIPEPAGIVLFLAGAAGLALLRRRC